MVDNGGQWWTMVDNADTGIQRITHHNADDPGVLCDFD